jgi:hypothetical protein
MEPLADPYRCLIEIRCAMENGIGLRTAIRGFIQQDRSEFAAQLAAWFVRVEQGNVRHVPDTLKKNGHRMALLSVLSAGLTGEAIFDRLIELENEMHQASLDEIEEKLRTLPLKSLLPLLLLQFPAFLLLLFGPILLQLRDSFG